MKDKKVYIQFALIIVASLISGGVIGYGIGNFEEDITSLWLMINDGLRNYGLYSYCIEFILLILGTYYYLKGKKVIQFNIDDDDNYETASRYLNLSMLFTNVSAPFLYIVLGLNFVNIIENIVLSLGCLVISLIWFAFLQKVVIDQIKKLAPEKQGNVFDTKFQKDWYNSCDEMERAQIGRCCYQVFKFMNSLYLLVMIIISCLSLSGWVEPIWIVVIGGLWLFQQAVYSLYALKEG